MRIALLSMLLGISFGQIPQWYINNELTGYSTLEYITGVGEGTSFEEAQSVAQAAIASQLQVTVNSTVKSFVQEIDSDDQSALLEVFSKATKSTVDETVNGIEIVKQKQIKKTYYVFAALNRTQYLAGLQVELDQLWSRTNKLIQDARTYVSAGNIFIALENYTDAQDGVIPFYSKKAFYDAISPTPYFISEPVTVSELVSEIRGILAGVTIAAVSGDKQTGNSGSALDEAIEFRVYYDQTSTGNMIPISDMPITIKYEDGTLVERGSTNQAGMFQTHVNAIPFSGNNGKVFARPNLVRLSDIYKKYLKNVEGVATYSLSESAPVAFALIIRDETGRRLPRVEAHLTKSIEAVGGIINDSAPISLEGRVATISEKEVEGKNGVQYMVTSELSLFMIVLATEENVASLSGSGKGVSSKNYEKAKAASFQNISIKKKDLAELLSKARNI